METFIVVSCVVWAIGSALTAILLWRRWPDRGSRVLLWALLLWPCAGGLVGSVGGLFMSLGRSGALEVIGETLVGVMLVAFAAHLCLNTVYILGLLRRRYGHGDKVDKADAGRLE